MVHLLFSDGVLHVVLDAIKILKFLHRSGVFLIIDPVLQTETAIFLIIRFYHIRLTLRAPDI
ncbi:MAG TPA: hypothetical protein DCR17_12420 [Verrucomicrobiales bacterium]|nr:hypothetical protein [Pedosphaera sp.]HAO67475.1 hypothetical protein [Verrucomicrobiales bacterium]HAR00672.1 hypothetical protein [Verrucomicrobiales bacterium]HAW02339.1 hypothetical protein [Verrucomicrobiales bacterium]HCP39818.1 hypothetical protein [Verrucomicrobiales bacterium]